MKPSDLVHAREQLKMLNEALQKASQYKVKLEKQLSNNKTNAERLEEVLPGKASTDQQRELLQLIIKVNQLEVEKHDLRSLELLKEHELQGKDLQIVKLKTINQLADRIIQHQKQIIDDHQMPCPPVLQMLYKQYKVDRDGLLFNSDVAVETVKVRS
ncbi:PREDICTED: kinesin-like protein KIF19 [Priapulus caudatus]|uniref:Kinesin-like protein KIF19 n=1 Tax=Priapulus caudatus TaxID=37621 RepID=A0ABM1EW64_PRICU|nr:PREDICTED: kinesin-like protein KIF19 [Priapulus caudatus]